MHYIAFFLAGFSFLMKLLKLVVTGLKVLFVYKANCRGVYHQPLSLLVTSHGTERQQAVINLNTGLTWRSYEAGGCIVSCLTHRKVLLLRDLPFQSSGDARSCFIKVSFLLNMLGKNNNSCHTVRGESSKMSVDR